MKKKKLMLISGIFSIFISFLSNSLLAQKEDIIFNKYHSPEEVKNILNTIAGKNSKNSTLHRIAKSSDGKDVIILEIGSEITKKEKTLPAIFIASNMEGSVPLSTEASLYLIKLIIEKPENYKDKTWYILPTGNPEAAERYFKKPLYLDSRNLSKFNDDMDDQTDEDGFDDLDGNGIITEMRVKDPSGEWLPFDADPRIMKRADNSKGEKGIFKLYSEGIDNDGDGKYNEDGPGGVNIGINFPHLFKFFTSSGGTWAGSEPESFELIKFVMDHKEIAMTFTFGSSNWCLNPPKSTRKSDVNLSSIRVPRRSAEMLGADPEQTYSLKEVMEMLERVVPPGTEVNEAMVSSFLGLGAVVNPLTEDLKFYTELSEKHKEFLKKNKLDGKRLEPESDKDGSFENWSYYQLGVPTFALDFWTLPEIKDDKKDSKMELTPDKIDSMSNDDFIKLGEEKIIAFLKDVGAPDNIKAQNLINGVKDGKMTTKRISEMLKGMTKTKRTETIDPKMKSLLAFSDKVLDGKGFVNWKSFNHPTLGEVEIGGAVPYIANTPPDSMLNKLLEGQVPWIFNIVDKMPKIKFLKSEVKTKGSGVYEVKIWIENTGYIPYPTAMGLKNKQITPVIVSLEGENYKIIDGKKRSLVPKIDGNKSETVKWLIYSEKPITLKIKATTRVAWNDNIEIKLGE